MTATATPPLRYIGAAIAALSVTVAWQAPALEPPRPFTFEQSPPGFALLHKHLVATGVAAQQTLVVRAATSLHGAGYQS